MLQVATVSKIWKPTRDVNQNQDTTDTAISMQLQWAY